MASKYSKPIICFLHKRNRPFCVTIVHKDLCVFK
jgi:hypothetical protein